MAARGTDADDSDGKPVPKDTDIPDETLNGIISALRGPLPSTGSRETAAVGAAGEAHPAAGTRATHDKHAPQDRAGPLAPAPRGGRGLCCLLLHVARRFADARAVAACAVLCLRCCPSAVTEAMPDALRVGPHPRVGGGLPGVASWVVAAAARGDAAAAAWLAQAVNCGGLGLRKSRRTAAALLSAALPGLLRRARGGDGEAMLRLGVCLERRVLASLRVVLAEARAADDAGEESDVKALGLAPLPPDLAGDGVGRRAQQRRDGAAATEWYRRAALAGVVGARTRHAVMLFKKRPGATGPTRGKPSTGEGARGRALALAEKLLRDDADAGSGAALALYGRLHAERGDTGRAVALLHRGADAGDGKALVWLGDACLRGGDAASAERLWLRAARLGDVRGEPFARCALVEAARDACARLAQLHEEGGEAGVSEPDLEEAARWRARGGLGVPDEGAAAQREEEEHRAPLTVEEVAALHQRAAGCSVADIAASGGYLNLIRSGLCSDDMEAVVALVAAHADVTRLGLGHNAGIGPTGGVKLMEGLSSTHCPGLQELFLRGTGLGDAGCRAVAAALDALPSVTKLGLDLDDIGPEGAKALALRLPSSNVTVLGMTLNHMGDEGAIAIAGAIAHPDSSLVRVYLNDNDFGDDGVTALAAALQANGSVERLGVSGNHCGDTGGDALLAVLAAPAGAALEKLCCSGNRFGEVVHWRLEQLPNVFINPRPRRNRAKEKLDGSKCRVVVVWQPHGSVLHAAQSTTAAAESAVERDGEQGSGRLEAAARMRGRAAVNACGGAGSGATTSSEGASGADRGVAALGSIEDVD